MNTKKKWLIPLGMWLVFEIVAVTLWLTKDNLFYLLNFSYIGSAIALGLLLFQLNYRHARRIGFIRYITFTAYAGLSWLNMSGEYADRRLMVLSIHWCF